MSTTPTELLEATVAAMESTAATEAPLDIASIKGMMDAFDPASLLPEMSEIFGSLASVCRMAVMIGPLVMLVMGFAYLFLAPKEANWIFGYRCYFGMGSVHAWRATQRLAGILFGSLGLVLTLLTAPKAGGFAAMDVTAMVWEAVECVVWQAVLALAATVAIHVTAAVRFDRKGELRKVKRNRG